jgi:uncharacterized SAM-binding protein YcdF (DUF218 family)
MQQSSNAPLLVVFAGGPHTLSRLRCAATHGAAPSPAAILLTGAEFDQPKIRDSAPYARLAAACLISLDCSRSTVRSCRVVAAMARGQAAVVAATSNYHAPRVRWLLAPLLPADCRLTVVASPDIRGNDILTSPLARKLVRGEILSWFYCLPVGLLWRLRAAASRKPLPGDERGS